jgi:hypothetical protein
MTVDIETLIEESTAAEWLAIGLELAAALGLTVTSWAVGGPSRTMFKFISRGLEVRDSLVADSIRAGFLSAASGTWLTLLADEVYGVTRESATYATPTVSFSNGGGGVYDRGIGEVIVKASSTGVTFRNTASLSLASGPGTTATIAFAADEGGSAGTVGVDDVDTIVTTMLGVTITASTAATGIDEQDDASLRDECTDSLGSVSVNGPPDSYNAVAKNSTLTGSAEVTRATTTEDATDGTVTVYLAGATGGVSAGAVTAVQDAIETWATPATITPTATSASASVQAVTATISGSGVPATAEADIEAALITYFATLDIGGLLAVSAVTSLIHEYLVAQGVTSPTVSVSVPSADVDFAEGVVGTVGVVTVTEV